VPARSSTTGPQDRAGPPGSSLDDAASNRVTVSLLASFSCFVEAEEIDASRSASSNR